jgi:hypothetical protein
MTPHTSTPPLGRHAESKIARLYPPSIATATRSAVRGAGRGAAAILDAFLLLKAFVAFCAAGSRKTRSTAVNTRADNPVD